MRTIRSARARRAGFTLLEVLLVLAILGVLAAMVVPALMGRQQSAMIRATQSSISGLESALKMYALEHDGQYPEGGQEALTQLLTPVDRNGQPMSPFLEAIPKDAWGETLFYQWPNQRVQNALKPAVWSAGPNRRNEDGSGDDIKNWETT